MNSSHLIAVFRDLASPKISLIVSDCSNHLALTSLELTNRILSQAAARGKKLANVETFFFKKRIIYIWGGLEGVGGFSC